jgi:threonine dehydrogenase-like Zn-dependent dehydrogenase
MTIQTSCSAISAGTEMLLYRGEVEPGSKLDDTIPSLQGTCQHPFKYGYSTVGRVMAAGSGVSCDWLGRTVFAFHCHEEAFNLAASEAVPVPPGIGVEDAVMLPSMETALSLIMDAAPVVGEHVVVLGQGVIGLLTTSVLSRFPLARLVTADRYEMRRARSVEMGADISLDPSMDAQSFAESAGLLPSKADLVIELSGRPEALEYATHLGGMEARIVVGSRYGRKPAAGCLGDDFHRHRLHILSSQVSRIDGSLSGRWTKARRLEMAWRLVRAVRPSRLITHRFDISRAAEAYRLLDEGGEQAIQIILTYPEG